MQDVNTLRKNVASQVYYFFLGQDANPRNGLVGASPVLIMTRDGGAVDTIDGAVSAVDATNVPGWY